MLAVATQGALVLQGALRALRHRFGWLRLCRLALATGLFGVGAKICGVQAVPCGDDGAGRQILKQLLKKSNCQFDVMFWSSTKDSGTEQI